MTDHLKSTVPPSAFGRVAVLYGAAARSARCP